MTSEGPSERQSNSPEVSIVIPVYERTEVLPDALDSVVGQSFNNWEAIVVADHRSEGELRELVETYDDRIGIVVDESGCVSGARNTGIDAARGEYVAFLDSDDVWKPEKIDRQLERFARGSDDLGLVYTGFVHEELNGQRWEHHPTVSGDVYLNQLERDWIHPPSTVMVTREVLESVGGFDIDLPTREDYELWLRVTEQFEVGYVDELLVTKREQNDSLSKDFTKRIEGDLAVYEDVRDRMDGLDLGVLRKHRILSTHHLVIGRDYESNGDRWEAIAHLTRAVGYHPFQVNAWAMLGIAILGIDRNGRFLTLLKRLVRA